MEQLTEKQYKTLKFVRGWLLADFIVFTIIVALIAVVGAIAAIAFAAFTPYYKAADIPQMKQIMPEVGILLIILIALGIAFIFFYIVLWSLLFSKKPNRKTTVSTTMLVYTSTLAALGVLNLVLSILFSPAISSGNDLYNNMFPAFSAVYSNYGITSILSFAYGAIFLFFAILLFRKTRGMPGRAFPYKPLFILYAAILYASQFSSIFFGTSSTYRDAGSIIASCILMGFFTFMYMFPAIAVFKALDDENFYENFMVINPGASINRYERARWQPGASSQEARFCMYCGAPLAPGSAFCRQCGKPVNRQQ